MCIKSVYLPLANTLFDKNIITHHRLIDFKDNILSVDIIISWKTRAFRSSKLKLYLDII